MVQFLPRGLGWRLCGLKTQLPNVLVNIHKNMLVLLNPRQMIIVCPPTSCIFLLLILLSALNSFPQRIRPSCAFELLPASLAFVALHASLWNPFKSSGALLPGRNVNDAHPPRDVASSRLNSFLLGNTTITLPRNGWGFLNNLAHLKHFSDSLSWHILLDQHWPCSTQPVTNSGCCCKH